MLLFLGLSTTHVLKSDPHFDNKFSIIDSESSHHPKYAVSNFLQLSYNSISFDILKISGSWNSTRLFKEK